MQDRIKVKLSKTFETVILERVTEKDYDGDSYFTESLEEFCKRVNETLMWCDREGKTVMSVSYLDTSTRWQNCMRAIITICKVSYCGLVD